MKYLNLFLILTIFTCYSGICSYITNFSVSEKSEIHHCHASGDASGNIIDGPAVQYSLSSTNSPNESCCIKTSTKPVYTPDERKVSFYKISIDDNNRDNSLLVLSEVLKKNTGDYKPPEIFLNNASFLL